MVRLSGTSMSIAISPIRLKKAPASSNTIRHNLDRIAAASPLTAHEVNMFELPHRWLPVLSGVL